ncbi:MAG: nicotinate-nucleotide--dimethylbenzimidazole phosphoribosyltransferase, partial [Clostridium fessum]
VGGFDLAAMAGAFLGGAIYHVPVVIDGVIAAAAAAAAGRIAPAATDYMLAAHVSAEPASIWLLDLIGVTPAIQAGLRLGEGTGALALFPLLDMALSIYRDMDTFAEMEIEEYKPLV